MSIENFITQKARCTRVFTFELIEGKEQEYQDYLRQVVEVIDQDAHHKGTFLEVLTLRSDAAESCRLFHRVFLFKDEEQRNRFAQTMAQSAIAFDGSQEKQDQRKAYVNTLRTLISTKDYTFC